MILKGLFVHASELKAVQCIYGHMKRRELTNFYFDTIGEAGAFSGD
jgi:hypothetical protein